MLYEIKIRAKVEEVWVVRADNPDQAVTRALEGTGFRKEGKVTEAEVLDTKEVKANEKYSL